MEEHDEVEYSGNWIQISTHESADGFLVEVRITGRGPGPLVRQWARIELEETTAFVDRDSARNFGLRQAKSFIDKMIPSTDSPLSIG